MRESWITSSRRLWIMNHGQKINESWIVKKFHNWIMNQWSKNIWESRIIILKRFRFHPRECSTRALIVSSGSHASRDIRPVMKDFWQEIHVLHIPATMKCRKHLVTDSCRICSEQGRSKYTCTVCYFSQFRYSGLREVQSFQGLFCGVQPPEQRMTIP